MNINVESKNELYRLLNEGRQDTINGNTRPFADAMKDLRKKLIDKEQAPERNVNP